jgi:hypothetical protein
MSMKLDTINSDILDTVTGGQAALACAIGAHEAGRKMEANRGWFSKTPSAQERAANALRGCEAGLRALGQLRPGQQS